MSEKKTVAVELIDGLTDALEKENRSPTPGPWEANRTNWRGEPSGHKVYIWGDIIEPEEGVCEGTATAVAIVDGNATSQGVTEANARLIAAAPALLAACKAALEFIQAQRMGSGNAEPQLLVAIAKAEGR